MVDEIITRQELIDAKRDARDLGKAVNEKVIVSPRYGEDFKSLPMIAAEFQISSDAAEAAAVSAADSANIAEAAATAATIGAGVFDTPEAGVDPVTGVADGAYFNVRSSSDESYVDEYQNVSGVATATGKSYPSATVVQNLASKVDLQEIRGLDSRSIFDFLSGTNLAEWKANKNTFDWSPIFQMAELYSRTYGGCKIRLPKRGSPYLLNGIAGQDGILNGLLFKHAAATNWRASTPSVVFEGEDQHIKLVAGSNNMHIVRMSSSFCSLQNVFLDKGDKTGVNALSLIPENTLSPHPNSQQSYNYIANVSIWGTKEGLTLQCGGDGGCYYNEFHKITYHGGNLNGTRALYLKPGIPKAGGNYASPPNRNKFFSFDVSNCNTAFDIESGDTNSFYGCTAELITFGTSPSAVPTALKIKERDGSVNNWYNQGNTFHGFTAETCTRDLEIMNPYTHFFGCRAEASKSVVHANFGRNGTFFGTIGSSTFPQIFGGIVQRGDALPSGMEANYGLSVSDHFADQGFRQAGITLNTSNVSNVASVSGARSRFTRLNKVVDWHLRFQFTATNVNSAIEVTVPENMKPHIDLYCTYDTNAQMRFSIQRINQSNVTSAHYAHFNADGTKLVIPAPSGGWSTFTDNRYDGVFVQLRYFMT